MKLQLLALFTIVATVTALPTTGSTNTYEKRAVDVCTEDTVGKECTLAKVMETTAGGKCRDVSLVCRSKLFKTTLLWMTDNVCSKQLSAGAKVPVINPYVVSLTVTEQYLEYKSSARFEIH